MCHQAPQLQQLLLSKSVFVFPIFVLLILFLWLVRGGQPLDFPMIETVKKGAQNNLGLFGKSLRSNCYIELLMTIL